MYRIDYDKPIHVHFIGIGGISMSGLAEVLLDRGFTVSGSDNQKSEITEKLESRGVRIGYPQSADNITGDIDLVVYTAAIHADNPEFVAAKEAGLPMLVRSQLLGQMMEHYANSIAVAGTHGKTTTTSMIAEILLHAGGDPTISVGGILESIKSNIRVGRSDVFLAEACEYTNSYHDFYPRYSVILNVEEDHMDFFKDIDEIRESFHRFAQNTDPDGALFIGGDIPGRDVVTRELDCDVVTFGIEGDWDLHAADIVFDDHGRASFTAMHKMEELGRVQLSVPGRHNIGNALAAIGVCMRMGIGWEAIAAGLLDFGGAKRRFEYKGTYNGAVVIDDYAHHPTEISASLAAAQNYPHDRLIVVFQPHTYTRTKAFLDDFASALSVADLVIMAKIYAAREDDIYGVSSDDIRVRIEKMGTKCIYLDTFEAIEDYLKKNLVNGDLLITMGAGDVVKIGEEILQE
ncbi:MAG: UDP-N-acetylmuramate--L-alanine ligase [Lachnospiraceae bacterium]|nr:UDP-N-acetylmuramate--L-alanine ligase [Lachnospiraceae bacterium]